VSTLWVQHAPSSAAIARRSLLAALGAAGLTGERAWDAALIASELVGNAVRHAAPLPSGQLAVHWSVDRDGYQISVTDGGTAGIGGNSAGGNSAGGNSAGGNSAGGTSVIGGSAGTNSTLAIAARHAGSRDLDGRGLQIVAELADSWGVAAEDGATTVWARTRTATRTPTRRPAAARG
jgi:two-component sensor histidine kinase